MPKTLFWSFFYPLNILATTFTDSILAVGEDSYWEGTSYESWAEIPQERKKLLQKAQLAINR